MRALACVVTLVSVLAAVGCTSPDNGSGDDRPAQAGGTSAATPPPPKACEGSGTAPTALGLEGTSQEAIAGSFAATYLDVTPGPVERLDACSVSVTGTEARFIFGASDATGSPTLLQVSSFADEDTPALSLQVLEGRLAAMSQVVCTGCVAVEHRIVSANGSTEPRKTPLPVDIEVVTEQSWTGRALLLRYMDADQRTVGVTMTMIPDGDFAAG